MAEGYARRGERRAFVCIDPKSKAITCRRFLSPDEPAPPRCLQHGRMVPQGNHPYLRSK